MQIENNIPVFLEFWESSEQPRLADLESYLNEHSKIYEKYFPMHCPRTDERLTAALQKYEGKMDDIRAISDSLPAIIEEVDEKFERTFGLGLELSFKLMVGTFGSNAFVTKDNRREIYFAVEKLSAERDHLKVITAHEIGHVTHFALATRDGMDWSAVDWGHGLTNLFMEGAATYLSKRIVPELQKPVYFSFDDEGDPWVKCYEENKSELKRRFLEDASGDWDMEKEREWFRLSGGAYFGYNRLGYVLGTDYVEQLVGRIGEDAALTFWNGNDLKADILEWLRK